MKKRKASAIWTGGLKDGRGTISTETGALAEKQYSFGTRFEEGVGTNPEGMLGAAHASCFTMALSGQLGAAGITAERLRTTAHVTIEKQSAGFEITGIHLELTAKIPGVDKEAFLKAANNAKDGCPVSKALKSVPITLDAKLEG